MASPSTYPLLLKIVQIHRPMATAALSNFLQGGTSVANGAVHAAAFVDTPFARPDFLDNRGWSFRERGLSDDSSAVLLCSSQDVRETLGGPDTEVKFRQPPCVLSMGGDVVMPENGNNLVRMRNKSSRLLSPTLSFSDDGSLELEGYKFNHLTRKREPIDGKVLRWPCSWPGCQTKSRRKEHLKRHQKIHESAEIYPCLLCDKKFRRIDNYRQHGVTHITLPHRKRGRNERFPLKHMLGVYQQDKKYKCFLRKAYLKAVQTPENAQPTRW